MPRFVRSILVSLVVALALAGCALPTSSAVPTPTAPLEATPASEPTATQTPVPTSVIEPTLTPVDPGEVEVLTWQREGGLAGFCDSVTVFADGKILLTSCRGEQVNQDTLSGAEINQVLAWVERLEPFEHVQSDGAVADGMTVRLTFAGEGAQAATEADVQAMLDFVAALLPPPQPPAIAVRQTGVRYLLANEDVIMYAGPGAVAVWHVGEQGYALIDQGNQHQGDGVFEGVLGSFLLLPPMPRAAPRPLEGRAVEGGTAFDLPGVEATLVLPEGYGVFTNNEFNRRGSLVSFDLAAAHRTTPYLGEIQFFTERSLRNFQERCDAGGGEFCFEGDYPDLERYQAHKAAIAQCVAAAPYEAKRFDGLCYFVRNHRCTGDTCVLREYATFLDERMVSVIFVLQDAWLANASDQLFASFDLSVAQPRDNDAGLPEPSPDRSLLVDQAAQRMYVYESGVLVRELPVSTGRPTSVTLTRAWSGVVGENLGSGGVDGGMYADFKWFLFQDLYGSILIHSVPYTRQGDDKVYDQLDALGIRPASRGCVRISPDDAQWLKVWNPVGVPIEISAWPGPVEQVAAPPMPPLTLASKG